MIKTQNRANVVVFAAREQSRPFDEAVAELANIVEIMDLQEEPRRQEWGAELIGGAENTNSSLRRCTT